MPDSRRRRGPHPKDRAAFAPEALPVLRSGVAELSWLLSRGYSDRAALKLVGDRHALIDRQRKALQRVAAADAAVRSRRAKQVGVEALRGADLAVDGFNVLLSLEAALSGGVLLLGRDGVIRELAAMNRHYRRLEVTVPALALLRGFFEEAGCARVLWYLDRPVSNSGRLKQLIERSATGGPPWQVRLIRHVDRTLWESPAIVASADSAVLDRCRRWFNLVRHLVERSLSEAWVVRLAGVSRESWPPG